MINQLDFGGFDPAFVGTSLDFSSVDALRLFNEFRLGTAPASFSELHPTERFAALSTESVLWHELRHFHDSLLAPYSAYVFRLRIDMLVNLLGLFTYILDREISPKANCIPVPLIRWWHMNDADRATWLAMLPPRTDGAAWVPVNVPVFEERDVKLTSRVEKRLLKSFDELLRLVSAKRDRIRDLTFNPRLVSALSSFQPWQVFELSGLAVQIQDLWSVYGADDVRFFVNRIVQTPESPYSAPLLLAQQICNAAGVEFSWALAGICSAWSLFGSYEHDHWDACPSVRFSRLWHLLSTEGVDLSRSVPDLFEHWSACLKLSTVADAIAETRKIYIGIPEVLVKHFEAAGLTRDKSSDLLLRVTTGVAQSSELMAKIISEDIGTYAVPYSYLESLDRYVNANVRYVLQSTGVIFGPSRDELQTSGKVITWEVEQAGKRVVLLYAEPLKLSEKQFVTADDALELSDLFALTEFVFSDLGRERGDVQRAGRVAFGESHLLPVEVY